MFLRSSSAEIFRGAVLALSAPVLFVACTSNDAQSASAPPPPEVGVVEVKRQPVDLSTELAGRTVAYEVSEIRPQVTGIIQRRLFTEGSMVKAGDVLYEIDPQVYRVAVNQATANLTSAKANLVAAKAKADRYTSLVEIDAVSKQDQADAVAAAAQAEASVMQAEAALEAARINLGYSRVTAPIGGRIGRSLVTTGALVTAAQPQPLAVIQRIDPMYVDIPQSSAKILELRREMAQGGVKSVTAEVMLVLEDGQEYSRSGVLQASEASVDPATGAITLRAQFPNPNGVLLPGMYVKAHVVQGQASNAILAPQAGIMRNATGAATAYVVNAENKVEVRQLELDRAIGGNWLVVSGLEEGDRLIVEGTAKVRPGQEVIPMDPEYDF